MGSRLKVRGHKNVRNRSAMGHASEIVLDLLRRSLEGHDVRLVDPQSLCVLEHKLQRVS